MELRCHAAASAHTVTRLSTVFYDSTRQVVLTYTVARDDGELRRSYHAQILDGRTSPAKLVSPDIVHDGTEYGAAAAAAAAVAWIEAQDANGA